LGVSKAFTRESDAENADEITPLRPHSVPGEKHYITREGADRLRQQVNALLEERRVLLSGNGEADPDAKANVRRIESAIQKLQRTIEAVIVADPPMDREKVAFGASVRIRDQHGEEETYQIVGTDEADPSQGRISSISPLARAVMNKKAGEEVRFKSPVGDQELTILNVRY
jgi:transcription elongation factor GreB